MPTGGLELGRGLVAAERTLTQPADTHELRQQHPPSNSQTTIHTATRLSTTGSKTEIEAEVSKLLAKRYQQDTRKGPRGLWDREPNQLDEGSPFSAEQTKDHSTGGTLELS